ncbi:hypothetical protein ACFVUB_34570 [Streptomyces niveus]|uniref:hypothetical protein n=1 Tax=Streptomyces niveus TaxID=193462 RepID=UPI0036DAC895
MAVLLAAVWVVLPLRMSWIGLAAGPIVSAVSHAFLDHRWPVRWLLEHSGLKGFADLKAAGMNGMYLTDLLCTSGQRVRACASGASGLEVDHDHLLQLVSVKVRIVPEFAGTDLVEPERRVGLVRGDDAADWTELVKRADELAELYGECDAVEEQDPLIVLRDLRSVIDDSDRNGDVVLQVKGAVGAFPGGEVIEERGSAVGITDRVGPGEHVSSVADPAGKLVPQARCELCWWCHGGQPSKYSKRPNCGVVHFQRQHAVHNRSRRLAASTNVKWTMGLAAAVAVVADDDDCSGF